MRREEFVECAPCGAAIHTHEDRMEDQHARSKMRERGNYRSEERERETNRRSWSACGTATKVAKLAAAKQVFAASSTATFEGHDGNRMAKGSRACAQLCPWWHTERKSQTAAATCSTYQLISQENEWLKTQTCRSRNFSLQQPHLSRL